MLPSINTKRIVPDHRSSKDDGVIRFNLVEENRIRIQARNEYDLMKSLTSLGYPIKKITAARNNEGAQRQFKLSSSSNYVVLDVNLSDDQLKNFDMLNELRDYLQVHDHFSLTGDKEISLVGTNSKYHRFLLKPKDLSKEDIIKSNMKVERSNLGDIAEVSPMIKLKKEVKKEEK